MGLELGLGRFRARVRVSLSECITDATATIIWQALSRPSSCSGLNSSCWAPAIVR